MGIYTASFWTKITSSANIPVFDPNVYTLKATIDDTGHQMPGSPYTYPINLTQGQNLFIVFTAPSGANVTELVCLSSSYAPFGGSGQYKVRYSLRSGSCAASGSHNNTFGEDIDVYYTAYDDANNTYYGGPVVIAVGNSYGEEVLQLQGDYNLVSVTTEQWTNPPTNVYIQGDCGTCGGQDYVNFDDAYAVVQPASITSSIFNAEIINISSSNYGIKISASVDGLLSNVDTEISWSVIGGLPVYYAGGFGATYYNTAISASVQRNNCSSGYEGSYVLYTLPASSSNSTSSQVDAQNAAQATFNANSQSYANTYGTCSPTGSTLDIFAKYSGSTATLQYRINGGSWNVLDLIDSTSCIQWNTASIIVSAGDSVEIETTGTNAISANSSGPCPAQATGCSYYQIMGSGVNEIYATVNGLISC